MAFVAIALLITSASVQASETDTRIESTAKDSYVFKTYLKDDNIKVASKEGVVTLSGSVNQDSHKSLAQETVANLPGVISVDNRIELKGDQPTENSDAWIALKVNTALLFHRNVGLSNTEVSVEKGIVTVRGIAENQAQKDLVTEYVNDISGIEGVQNEMTVAQTPENAKQTMGEKIDDASITAQAKMALLFHGSTSALNTTVHTKEGVVTVSGKATNDAEKTLVTKLVNDIRGVTSVINNMTI